MEEIIINTEFITLGQFLKFLGLISTGGEAKEFLSKNSVFLNENVENRRGKKLFSGDIILILGKKYKIIKK